MAFRIEAFQNRFLSPGQTRVDGILTVSAGGGAEDATAGKAPVSNGSKLVVGFILDKSGSMAGERIEAVKNAISRAIDMLDERASFFVVAFDGAAHVFVPVTQATAANKAKAAKTLSTLRAQGGTAMSTGLATARAIFAESPDAIHEAIFLTDGKNESDAAGAVASELARCEGIFECDCWGVGTDWRVGEVQEIAAALLGKASLIPDAAGIDAAFRSAMEKASAKSMKDVRLRVWTPMGSKVVFVKQVNPTIEEMTNKGKNVSPQVHEFMTGAWGAGESRDFHVAIDVRAGNVDDEMLAARPSIVYLAASGGGAWAEREEKSAEGRLFAKWTADDSLSSRIDRHVAHYTGQDELAQAIKEGLDQHAAGNESEATHMLGRAVKIAHASNNNEMTQRLKKVVEVLDAATGTVRLKKDVKRAATMDLELESRTTKRVARREPSA